MTRPQLLIDTDPGVDDALAILMAYAHADVAGLSIAAGNVGLSHTVRNARTLVDLVGAATPVFAGCAAPLVRAPDEDAAFVHGQDGFGDIGFPEPLAPLAGLPYLYHFKAKLGVDQNLKNLRNLGYKRA